MPTFLDTLAVPASAVGAGYVRKDLDDGSGLDTPTLDLCGYDFSATEARRTDRLQFNVTGFWVNYDNLQSFSTFLVDFIWGAFLLLSIALNALRTRTR